MKAWFLLSLFRTKAISQPYRNLPACWNEQADPFKVSGEDFASASFCQAGVKQPQVPDFNVHLCCSQNRTDWYCHRLVSWEFPASICSFQLAKWNSECCLFGNHPLFKEERKPKISKMLHNQQLKDLQIGGKITWKCCLQVLLGGPDGANGRFD